MNDFVTQVRAVLATTPARWLALTQALPSDLLLRAPAPGEWSAADCLRHLVDTERGVFPVRVQAFLAGRDIQAFDPDAGGTPNTGQALAALAAELAALRAESLTALERVTAHDLARTARHSELGTVRLDEMLYEWAAHDLMHTVQAERAMMQPFIAACGPWRSYFADHDVALQQQA
jgi:hypothetical protein